MGHGTWNIEKNPKFAIVLRTPTLRAGSQFRNPQLNSWLLTPYVCLVPYALYLVPATLAAYADRVAVDPTQLIAKVLPSS